MGKILCIDMMAGGRYKGNPSHGSGPGGQRYNMALGHLVPIHHKWYKQRNRLTRRMPFWQKSEPAASSGLIFRDIFEHPGKPMYLLEVSSSS